MSCESLVLAPSSRDPKDTRETCVRLLCGCSSSNRIIAAFFIVVSLMCTLAVCLTFPIILIGLRDCVLMEVSLRYQFIQQMVHAQGLIIKGVQQHWMTYENFSHVPFVAWLTVMSSCYPVVKRSLYTSLEVSSLKVSLTGLRTMLCFQTVVNCTSSHGYGLLLVARYSELKQLRRLVPLLFKHNHLLLRQVQ